MSSASSRSASQYQALYKSTVQDAAERGGLLMGKLVVAARASLQAREAACRDLRERDALAQSAKQLRSWESELCSRFPKALLEAFEDPQVLRKAATQSVDRVAFDELELMDEAQVLTSVTLARTLQVAILAAEASLAELNTLICTTLGLGAVNPERNPLRPQIYVHALRTLIEQTQLPSTVQLDWLAAMSVTLGNELRAMYVQLADALRAQGVVSAGYAIVQTYASHASPGIGRGVAQDVAAGSAAIGTSRQVHAIGSSMSPRQMGKTSGPFGAPVQAPAAVHRPGVVVDPNGKDATLLTLDKLRRLLAGELDEPEHLSSREQFARRFAQEFEQGDEQHADDHGTDFDATVPAALEALTEMKQVDAVVKRLQRRHGGGAQPVADGDTSIEAVRVHLRSNASGVGQSLSLEVITMMVDNIAQDERLLPPIQQLIRRLEPALLRLALVDPRLFTNKQHPARMLVQEVAHRSLAYLSVHAYGFTEYMRGVEEAVGPLLNASIENAEPFELALRHLNVAWERAAKAGERSREDAKVALQNAERRNILAEKIAREIEGHPDAAQVPDVVIDFLCGPWAQVVAQARMSGPGSASAAERFQALVSALLWSAHPDLTAKNITKLTRLVPRLLATLREGLETIHYPPTRTSVFLEALMGLHQQAFRAAQKSQVLPIKTAPLAAPVARPHLVEDGNPWVAPEEARASNFMDLPDLPQALGAGEQVVQALDAGVSDAAAAEAASVDDLTLGSWVELLVNEQWTRTQLSWASPHGTLFLFTNAAGATQSMTRRSRDKLVQAGQLRVISGRPMVDGALNAVAQVAMRNSVNTQF